YLRSCPTRRSSDLAQQVYNQLTKIRNISRHNSLDFWGLQSLSLLRSSWVLHLQLQNVGQICVRLDAAPNSALKYGRIFVLLFGVGGAEPSLTAAEKVIVTPKSTV